MPEIIFDANFVLEAGVMVSLIAVLVLIALDSIVGMALAIKHGEFDVRLWPQFLMRGVLPYVISLGAVALGALFVPPPYQVFFAGIFAYMAVTTLTKYAAELNDKRIKLFDNGTSQPSSTHYLDAEK